MPFAVGVVRLDPGEHAYDEAEWRGAPLHVAGGEIELEGVAGRRERFGRGAVIALAGLPLRALHNHGAAPARLVTVSRRH
jgi:hypothetical protein